MKETFDIAVIGGGPAGLFATYYAGLRNAKTILFESSPQVGGQVSAGYRQKLIKDLPMFNEITGEELIERLVNQAKIFDPEIKLTTKIVDISFDNNEIFTLTDQNNKHYSARKIIVATGIGAYMPKKLAIPYDDLLENTHIHYGISNPNQFAGKIVSIAGGGDSAIDWALHLSDIAKEVILIHRRDQFRALESSVLAAKNKKNITFATPFMIDGLSHDKILNELSLSLVKSLTGETTIIKSDSLIVNYGFKADTKLLTKWGLNSDKDGLIVNSAMETNIPGIFAIGDIASYPNKTKLIVSEFGEAPTAINAALRSLRPNEGNLKHSTSM